MHKKTAFIILSAPLLALLPALHAALSVVLDAGACSKKLRQTPRCKKLMGSHRLRVALAILFRNRFRCPYCNESTALEIQQTTQSRH